MAADPEIEGLSRWRPIARGGLAVVWEAWQPAWDRQVAVKVYERGWAEADQRHFVREASAADRLAAHPGIVTPYGVGRLPDKRPYLVMELCPGGSLTRWLEPENRPSQDRVRQVGVQIADVLAAAHAARLLHCDVKPANILIDRAGGPRLADFGSAVERGTERNPAESLWVTPAWAPPEAFRMEPATEAGDVYSLAATLYALLAGRPPHATSAAPAPLEEVLETVQRPVLPVPGVSRPLMEVLLAALDDDPAARPSAATFFNQLARVPLHSPRRRATEGAAVRSAPTGRPPQTWPDAPAAIPASTPATGDAHDGAVPSRRPERRAVLPALVAAAVGVAVVIASATTWLGRESVSSGVPATATQSATADGNGQPSVAGPSTSPASSPAADAPAPGAARDRTILLADPVDAAKPFQAARIQGSYPGGGDTLLRVQRWEKGSWATFPVPARTDASGEFTAYVELEQPGRYRLRVLDPGSGARSKSLVLVIDG